MNRITGSLPTPNVMM